MDPDDKRQRSLRLYQLLALAISLVGFAVTLHNVHGWGPSVAGSGFAAALVLEWMRLGK